MSYSWNIGCLPRRQQTKCWGGWARGWVLESNLMVGWPWRLSTTIATSPMIGTNPVILQLILFVSQLPAKCTARLRYTCPAHHRLNMLRSPASLLRLSKAMWFAQLPCSFSSIVAPVAATSPASVYPLNSFQQGCCPVWLRFAQTAPGSSLAPPSSCFSNSLHQGCSEYSSVLAVL